MKGPPYLNNYPFKIEDLEVFLIFDLPNHLIKEGDLVSAVISSGNISYNTRSFKTGLLLEVLEENLLEARERVLN